MWIAHIDKVKADDVVTGVTGPGVGLVKAVNVESRGEHGPDAQDLG